MNRYELWLDDDQMPSCEPCLGGQHERCPDILRSEKYGMFACGCENPIHEESA